LGCNVVLRSEGRCDIVVLTVIDLVDLALAYQWHRFVSAKATIHCEKSVEEHVTVDVAQSTNCG